MSLMAKSQLPHCHSLGGSGSHGCWMNEALSLKDTWNIM